MTSNGRDDPEKLPNIEALLETYYLRLAAHGRKLGLGSDRDDARSSARTAALDSILGMLKAEENGEKIGNPWAYLFRAIERKAIDRFRKKGRRPATFHFAHESAESIICTRSSCEVESRTVEIDEIVSELTEEHKRVIELFYYDGKSAEEMAEILEMSKATVYRRLKDAVGQLQIRLSDDPQS